MLFFCLFLLLSVLTVFLCAPVVIRYTRDDRDVLSFHFVFFSVSFFKGSDGEKKKKRKRAKKDGAGAPRVFLRALQSLRPKGRLCLYSLPMPKALAPDRAAFLTGIYLFLASALSAPFGYMTTDPLLNTKTQTTAPLDLRLQIRTFAFLYTFLMFLVHYQQEKEAKRTHGRNKNE